MRVLVTGASGMLGRTVARTVLESGHAVRTFQRGASSIEGVQDARGSVTDRGAVTAAVEGVDAVIHLAAKVSFAGRAEEFNAVNVEGTRTLVEAARRAGAHRFVMVSSPSVAHAGLSIVGDGARAADPARARGEYARSKAAAELLALEADGPGFSVVAVRPHIVWGPGDTQLIERVVERARRRRLPLLGGGLALIDTTYVDNAASAIAAALDRAAEVHGRSFVVTNGEPRTVAELLAAICGAAGVPAPAWSVPAAVARGAGGLIERVWSVHPGADEPPMTRFLAEQLSTSHWYDQRETRAALAWQPSVSLDAGIERLRLWYATAPADRLF
ncbi:NAD-dependent epimerase/dehydratase family protein [Subtercola boreus]|uniref:Nucleoside-diphosphate sugar epimerase n=1 Tax=Subtercola boreus TaxID=120213 RepID=A0A3E0W9E9_9MICO|nr:NAD-dependent epimerase/dehydratase family protein [Subtercola boreus]RFA20245.1 nucleoside-diphosphate sugar epimerase [Subtercola boreus]RFA20397.1 nucleoside-diphosphate sugar epimerase [Subtercola boreus]RFA26649.1 nucleoside-diphosphate sugar epimerase [Subtercola boreus]